jgi:hypothetical protein
MPLFLLSMLGAGKSAMGAAFSWLSRQSPATLLCIVLCLALAIDHIALLSAHRQNRKLQHQVVLLSGELQKISTAKNKQQVVTKETVKVVTKLVHDADERAKVVEDAPPAPNCRTKPEVLNADV